MAKRIKMVLYAEPGTGKSVFAAKWPKPFFICTDGNYEWLEDFGADPNAHIDCHSYADVKKAINGDYDDYETIVLDLAEDAFKWNEQEYCVRNRIEHLSDLGYGKGYDATRNEYFIDISKLLALDKNILILMHGNSWTEKDRRGVEHWKYGPTDRIPAKVIKMIEGRVRYFLRAYTKDEELENGTLIKKRWLSLVPKPNEFGIIRGVNENQIPHDIELDFNIFISTLSLKAEDICGTNATKTKAKTTKHLKLDERKIERLEIDINNAEPTFNSTVLEIEHAMNDTPKDKITGDRSTIENNTVTENKSADKPVEQKPITNEDKLAAIRAKLANMKK